MYYQRQLEEEEKFIQNRTRGARFLTREASKRAVAWAAQHSLLVLEELLVPGFQVEALFLDALSCGVVE